MQGHRHNRRRLPTGDLLKPVILTTAGTAAALFKMRYKRVERVGKRPVLRIYMYV